MKQKYTITVADMQLNIISDASPDEVENIVGMLDRRMRDINLKSPRCTKNEAAILCALSYCSERIAMQEAFKKVEKDAFRFAGENEKLKKSIESMQEELDTLRKDASVMRSILDRAAISATPAPASDEEKPKYVPKPFQKKAEDDMQISAFESVEEAPVEASAQPVAPVEEAPTQIEDNKSQKNTSKSRVGNMFDLLTFSDV
ncbi:MAG: cell division protein ZapA [Clostridia bacterium]|nr:cell division protein ZapA [Clostridia bacterium]